MPSSSTRYLRLLFTFTFVAVVAIATFNYLIDPYGIYHANQSWDSLRSRPAINLNLDLHKVHAVEFAQADTLLLGSSRVAMGIDTTNPLLPAKTYNLAVWGTAAHENWRYLQHAAAFHMPKTVILGIDYEYFEWWHNNPPTYSDERLAVDADGQPNPRSSYADLSDSLLSFSAIGASFFTLWGQTQPSVNDLNGYTQATRQEGPRRISAVLADVARLTSRTPGFYRSPTGTTPQLDDFKKTVAFCADHHIRLIVFVNPMHATLLDTDTADWDKYADWFTTVVSVLNSTPGLDWEMWDFAGFNSITTEPFPAPSSGYNEMKYYRECSHYLPVVGEMVLQRIFENEGIDGFGVRVTSATVADDLERLQRERAAWHASNKAQVPLKK